MHEPESVLENEINEIFGDFRIRTDHPILARRPDLLLINKKKSTCHFSRSSGPQKEKNGTIDKYQDLVRDLKKLWNMTVTVI